MKRPNTTTLVGVLAGVQLLTLAALWNAGPAVSPVVAQGIPDSGKQLQQLIDQQKATNAKLDRLVTLLVEGKLQVAVKGKVEIDRR